MHDLLFSCTICPASFDPPLPTAALLTWTQLLAGPSSKGFVNVRSAGACRYPYLCRSSSSLVVRLAAAHAAWRTNRNVVPPQMRICKG